MTEVNEAGGLRRQTGSPWRLSMSKLLDAYLRAFEQAGAKTSASITYYEGGGTLLQLAQSPKPEVRAQYERLAQWVLDRQRVADEQARAAGSH